MFYTFYKNIGNKIYLRYKTDDHTTHSQIIEDYKPKLYVPQNEESEVKSIFGENLRTVPFGSIKEAKDFAEKYKNVPSMKVQGNSDFGNQFIVELNKKCGGIKYVAENIRYCIFDIEVDCIDEFPNPEEYKWPVSFCSAFDSHTDTYTLFGLKNHPTAVWRRDKCIEEIPPELKIESYDFDTEEQLLRAMVSYFNTNNFDFTSGWNSEEFDMPYFILRAMFILSEKYVIKMMSPFNKIDVRKVINDFGSEVISVDVFGVPHIDYMLLYKKHILEPRENYKLDFIARHDTGKGKIEYEGSLHDLYVSDYQKYGDYNLVDSYLIVEIEKANGLFGLTYALSYYTLSNFRETMKTVKMWENLMAKYLYGINQSPIYYRERREKQDFEGGFVYEVKLGRKRGVVSYDLRSLYPHCEMQYNIGIETHIPYDQLPSELKHIVDTYSFDDLVNGTADTSALKKYNVAMAGNFEFYRKDIPSSTAQIKRELYKERSANKKLMLKAESDYLSETNITKKSHYKALETLYDNMQSGLKICLNAGYGATGNKSFLYFKLENASAITASGRLVNKYTKKRLNEFLNKLFGTNTDYVVAGDTDSLYFDLSILWDQIKTDDMNKKVDQMDRFCKEVMSPEISRICKELCEYMNAYEDAMVWNREAIAKSAFWTAKKRYAMYVCDSEGVRYSEPKLKMKGLEPIKSSYPLWARNELKEYIKLILDGDEDVLHRKIKDTEGMFYKFDIQTIAMPKGVGTIYKYSCDEGGLYKKKTPQATRACIVHNHLVEKLGLKNVRPIKDGDKIKIIELKKPNPINEDIIAFDGKLPPEFKLDKFVNRDSIFEVAFMNPLRTMLESVGWHEEKIETLF